MKKIIFALGVMLLQLAPECFSQTISVQSDTLKWYSTTFTDLNTNAVVSNMCQFITYSNGRADWVQGGGNYIVNWTLTNPQGNWDNPTSDGTITYTIESGQMHGTLQLAKNGQSISIRLTVTGSTSPINLTYSISSYEKI